MTTETLYELRVLSGEQRGASSVIQPGQTLRIGQDWTNEVVLQQAEGMAMLSFSPTGTLLLQVGQGGGAVAETALESGSRAELGLYEPFTVGGVRLAVGRLGASQWAPLFASAPQGERAASAAPVESESASQGARDASPHGRRRRPRRRPLRRPRRGALTPRGARNAAPQGIRLTLRRLARSPCQPTPAPAHTR